MNINKSGARFSAIVGIGQKIKKMSEETGKEYLLLNRGVNSVCNIDLEPVIKNIDFNSASIQVYPPNSGLPELKEAINQEYFDGLAEIQNITITAGSMGGLDLIFQLLDVNRIFLPSYYWGAYANLLKIRGKENEVYDGFDELKEKADLLKGEAVVICDPNNPLGNKYKDTEILGLIKMLSDNGTMIIFDSPYRRVFYDSTDDMYQKLMNLPGVIIIESFSKSVGLSGQRVGFIHSTHSAFNEELGIRILYMNNGVNAFAQYLVYHLLSSKEGKRVVKEFLAKTTRDIKRNIDFMKENNLLAEEFYQKSEIKGIFVIINKSEQELLDHQIGSVSLSFFTHTRKEEASKYARICISVPHEKFVRFLTPLVKR